MSPDEALDRFERGRQEDVGNYVRERAPETLETEDCEAAFRALKQKLTSAPVLLPPNPDQPWRIETDASDFGIGAVLSQVDS
jgi:hypothetical protein